MGLRDWFIKPSTREFIAEGRRTPGYTLSDFLHGYIYARWPYLYIGIGTGQHPLSKWFARLAGWYNRLIPKSRHDGQPAIGFADGYHGKAVPLETAKRLVSIREEIKVPDLEQVIPYKRARSLIMHNPDHIIVLDCPCRSARPNPCLPLDVCLLAFTDADAASHALLMDHVVHPIHHLQGAELAVGDAVSAPDA